MRLTRATQRKLALAAGTPAGALVLLAVLKGIAYMASLWSFRGGPIFPAMFIGAAAGIALSHLPGLPLVAGVAMGIGAMTTVMLGLPMTGEGRWPNRACCLAAVRLSGRVRLLYLFPHPVLYTIVLLLKKAMPCGSTTIDPLT